jgi:S1-C subfamily serine protease
MDQKLIIRHLSGSKINQSNEFPIADFKELSIGRDEGVDIQYDPEKDDLVSRRHAVICREEGNRFSIKDEESRNGTYVNKQRISGAMAISHGDILQFGPGGPEFSFELDPPPKSIPPPTREASAYRRSKPTREVSSAAFHSSENDTAGSSRSHQKGRFTVLHESFNAYKQKTLRTQLSIGAGLLGVLILVAGMSYYFIVKSEQNTKTALNKTIDEITKNDLEKMSPEKIAEKYSKSVVYIKADWTLIDGETNKQVYHRHIHNGKYPCYLEIEQKLIPWLIADDEKLTNKAIGGTVRGTGFSVNQYGSILTNKHVAAGASSAWGAEHRYMQKKSAVYDVIPIRDEKDVWYVVSEKKEYIDGNRLEYLKNRIKNWVPARDAIITVKKNHKHYLANSKLISRDTLKIYFPGDPNPMPGHLSRKSIRHDVALVTVDFSGVLPYAPLEESDKDPAIGEEITVLGYPKVSEDLIGIAKTSNPFDPRTVVTEIYSPTLTTGNMGKRIDPNKKISDSKINNVWASGDMYQLTANATGAGNSGGPVFNSRGRVTGIFFAGAEFGGATVTYAIPIKYGRDLLKGYKSVVD